MEQLQERAVTGELSFDVDDEEMFVVEVLQYGAFQEEIAPGGGSNSNCNCNSNTNSNCEGTGSGT